MQKQIIVLNGMARSGKQEVFNILNKKIQSEQYSIVDPVREFLKSLGVRESGKSEKWRRLMSDIKLALDDYDDVTYQCVREKTMDFLRCSPSRLLTIDMREIKDISRFRKEFDATIVFVQRDDAKIITSNVADANVFDIDYDYTIPNNGELYHLEVEVIKFLQWLMDNKCNGVINSQCLKLDCKYCQDDDGGLYCGKN